eukprot:scaffold4743_cov171-Amphora_coffeaeformis.AAC.25
MESIPYKTCFPKRASDCDNDSSVTDCKTRKLRLHYARYCGGHHDSSLIFANLCTPVKSFYWQSRRLLSHHQPPRVLSPSSYRNIPVRRCFRLMTVTVISRGNCCITRSKSAAVTSSQTILLTLTM